MTARAEAGGEPVRLLVLAPNWLGDLVMTSPLLSLLHAARDDRDRPPHVTLAARRPWLPLFLEDPRCDSLVSVERGGRHGGWPGVPRLGRDLRACRPDAVVLGPPSLRAGLVASLSGAVVRVGFRGDGRRALLSHALRRRPRGERHHAEELLELGRTALAAVGLREGPAAAGAPLLPGCAGLAAAAAGPGPELWVLAPGTTYGEAKTWPAARVAEFLGAAVEGAGARVALLGDAAARPFVAQLRSATGLSWRDTLPGGAGVVDLVGTTDLAEAVSVLKAARVFVGNDSGLMHVAGALGLATVGIFGSSNPEWTAPLGPRTRAVTAQGFACRPCYRPRCNQERFCLETVSAADVVAAVRGLLGTA